MKQTRSFSLHLLHSVILLLMIMALVVVPAALGQSGENDMCLTYDDYGNCLEWMSENPRAWGGAS